MATPPPTDLVVPADSDTMAYVLGSASTLNIGSLYGASDPPTYLTFDESKLPSALKTQLDTCDGSDNCKLVTADITDSGTLTANQVAAGTYESIDQTEKTSLIAIKHSNIASTVALITVNAGIATVTTTLPHLLNSGDYVKISGTGFSALDVQSTSVTVTDATHFTYPVSVATAWVPGQGTVESINSFDEFGIPEEAKKLHGEGVASWRAPLVRENAAGYSKLYNAHLSGTSRKTVTLSAESTLAPLREIQCAEACDGETAFECQGFNVTESTNVCVLYTDVTTTSTDTVNGDAAFVQGYAKRTFSSINTDPTNVTTVPAFSYGYETLIPEVDSRWYSGAINYQAPAASVVDTFNTAMSRYIVKLSGAPPAIADGSVEWDNNGRTCYTIDACNQTLMKVFADPNISSFLSSDYSACEGCPERGYSKTAHKVLLSEVPAIKLASNYQPIVTINETLKRPVTIGGTDLAVRYESRTNPYTYSPPGYGGLDEDLKSIVTSFTQFRVILDVTSVSNTDIKSRYVWYGHGGKSFLNVDTPINCANTAPNFGYGPHGRVNSSYSSGAYRIPPEYIGTDAFFEPGTFPTNQYTIVPWGCGETETRTIAVTTPPSNGGRACPSTVQTKTFPNMNGCFGPNGVAGTTYIAYTAPTGEGDAQVDLAKLDTMSENSLWKSESSSYVIFKYEGGKYRRYPNLVIWRRHFYPTSLPTSANLPPRANRNPFPGGWSLNGIDGYKVLDSSKFGTPMPDPYIALGQIRTLFIRPSALADRWAYDNRQGCDKTCADKTIGYARYHCRGSGDGNCDPSVGAAVRGPVCSGTYISCVPATTSADFGNYFAPVIPGLRYVSGIVHSGGSRTTHDTDSLIISVVYEADPGVVGVDTLTYGSLFPTSIISTVQSCTIGITTSVGNCVCPAGKYYTGRTDIYDIYGSCQTCMMTLAPNVIWDGSTCQTRICESGSTPSASKTECVPIFTCPSGAISNPGSISASNGACTCPFGSWYDGSACNPCGNPAANQYVVAACTPTANTVFAADNVPTCLLGDKFLVRNQGSALSVGSPSVCSLCSYPADNQYVVAVCTQLTNTVFETYSVPTCSVGSTFLSKNRGSPKRTGSPSVCLPCGNPAANEYVYAACIYEQDTIIVSETIPTCTTGSTFLVRNQGSAESAGSRSVCSPCSNNPAANEYVSAACTRLTNTVFATDTAITCISGSTFLRNMIQGSAASAGSPSACLPCGNPAANEYVSAVCTPTANTVFTTDIVPTCSLGSTFLRNMIQGDAANTGSPSVCLPCGQPPGGDYWQTYVSAVCTLVANTQFAVDTEGYFDRCPTTQGYENTYYIPGDLGSSTRVGRPTECRTCSEPRPDQYVLTPCGARTDTVFGTQPVCRVYDELPEYSTYLLPSTNTGNYANKGTRGQCVPCGRGILGKYVTAKCTPTSNTQYDTQLTNTCATGYTAGNSMGDATTLGNENRCKKCREPVSTSTILEYVIYPCGPINDTYIGGVYASECNGANYRKGFSSGSSKAAGSAGACEPCTIFFSPLDYPTTNVGKYVSRACGGIYDTGVSAIPACAQNGYYRPMTSAAAYGNATSVGVLPACVQCTAPSAALNQYTVAACTQLSNTVFGTQPVCKLGETYLSGNTTGTIWTPGTLGTCVGCDYPSAGQYVSGLCTPLKNTQFKPFTPCVAGQTFATTGINGTPTMLGTNSCTQCTPVPAILPGENVPAKYVSQACTPTSDTVLSAQATTCQAGYTLWYVYDTPGSPGATGVPASCWRCSEPNSGQYQYVSNVCTSVSNTEIVTPVSAPTCTGDTCIAYIPGTPLTRGVAPVCVPSASRYLACTIAADGIYRSQDITTAMTYWRSNNLTNPVQTLVKAKKLTLTSCAVVFTTMNSSGTLYTRYQTFTYSGSTGCNLTVTAMANTAAW